MRNMAYGTAILLSLPNTCSYGKETAFVSLFFYVLLLLTC
jgi:hypothetical protein